MAKIMLVEDDNNLREIYEARLLAEGYEIVSAQDGEEALALAVKEKPDLIIADVMMPKISGFDMLDILRSTPETKDAKVIMMTALSQAEDKSRADKLGADRYLVKSQVTLEDVAKVAREVLGGEVPPTNIGTTPPATPPPAPAEPTPTPVAPPQPTPPPVTPTEPPSAPVAPTTTVPAAATPPAQVTEPSSTVTPQAQTTAEEEAVIDKQIENFVEQKVESAPPVVEPAKVTGPAPTAIEIKDEPSSEPTTVVQPTEPVPTPVPEPAAQAPQPYNPPANRNEDAESGGSMSQKKIIQPISDMSVKGPDLNSLLEKEKAKEAVTPPSVDTVIAPKSSDNSAPAGTNTNEHSDIAL